MILLLPHKVKGYASHLLYHKDIDYLKELQELLPKDQTFTEALNNYFNTVLLELTRYVYRMIVRVQTGKGDLYYFAFIRLTHHLSGLIQIEKEQGIGNNLLSNTIRISMYLILTVLYDVREQISCKEKNYFDDLHWNKLASSYDFYEKNISREIKLRALVKRSCLFIQKGVVQSFMFRRLIALNVTPEEIPIESDVELEVMLRSFVMLDGKEESVPIFTAFIQHRGGIKIIDKSTTDRGMTLFSLMSCLHRIKYLNVLIELKYSLYVTELYESIPDIFRSDNCHLLLECIHQGFSIPYGFVSEGMYPLFMLSALTKAHRGSSTHEIDS